MSSTCPEIKHRHDARHAVGGALMAIGQTSTVARATLEDVARVAGVSLATVDRVVNRREGVREKTIARVEAAVAKLGYRADAAATRLARNQSFRFAFILPSGANTFMANLTEQVRRTADWLAGQRGFIDVLHVDVFDPDALARRARVDPAVLSRRGDDRARSCARARRDRRSRGARRCGRDAGVRRAELAPHPLRRHRQSGRRPHRRNADGAVPARTQRSRRRHRGIAGAARPRRAAVRLPPDPVRRVSRTSSPCRRSRGATTARVRARSPRHCWRSGRTSSASTVSAPATAASRRRWRSPAAPATSSGSRMN